MGGREFESVCGTFVFITGEMNKTIIQYMTVLCKYNIHLNDCIIKGGFQLYSVL